MLGKNILQTFIIIVIFIFSTRQLSAQLTETHVITSDGLASGSVTVSTINFPTFDPLQGELIEVELRTHIDLIMLGAMYEISNYSSGSASLSANFNHNLLATVGGASLNQNNSASMSSSDDFKGPTPNPYFLDVSPSSPPYAPIFQPNRAEDFLAASTCSEAISNSELWEPAAPYPGQGKYLATEFVLVLPGGTVVSFIAPSVSQTIPDDANDAQICASRILNDVSRVTGEEVNYFKRCFTNFNIAFEERITAPSNWSETYTIEDTSIPLERTLAEAIKYEITYEIRYTYIPAADIPDFNPDFPGCVALSAPVLNFQGRANNLKNDLYWQGQDSPDLAHYQIERSLDATNWKVLKTLSKGRADYHFADQNLQSRAYYYRLASVNNSGSKQYSNAIFIENTSVELADVKIFPNPTSDFVQLTKAGELPLQAKLYNIKQHLLWEGELSNESTLKLNSFAPGKYLLKLSSPDKTWTEIIIKQ